MPTPRKKLFDFGLIAEIVWKDAQNAVEVQQQRIVVAEAAISAFDESADNQTASLTKEVRFLQADLTALKPAILPRSSRKHRQKLRNRKCCSHRSTEENAKGGDPRAKSTGRRHSFSRAHAGRRLDAGDEFIRLVNTSGLVAELRCPGKGNARTSSREASFG